MSCVTGEVESPCWRPLVISLNGAGRALTRPGGRAAHNVRAVSARPLFAGAFTGPDSGLEKGPTRAICDIVDKVARWLVAFFGTVFRPRIIQKQRRSEQKQRRSSQEQAEAARSSQEQPPATRNSQQQSQVARLSQEQPAAARSRHTHARVGWNTQKQPPRSNHKRPESGRSRHKPPGAAGCSQKQPQSDRSS